MRNYSKENRYNMPFFNQQTTFEVIFDNNPERVFYAGQKISGRVRLTLHKEHTLHGKHSEFFSGIKLIKMYFFRNKF